MIAEASNALALELPQRSTQRPETTNSVPHVQLGVDINRALAKRLLQHVAKLPHVELGPTRVSLPGAIGFQLDPGLPLARPDAIVGGMEFAHMHPDGSLHASLDPDHAQAAIDTGWAVARPWARSRPGWDGFVMIYTPLTEADLKTVIRLVEASYAYVTGKNLPE